MQLILLDKPLLLHLWFACIRFKTAQNLKSFEIYFFISQNSTQYQQIHTHLEILFHFLFEKYEYWCKIFVQCWKNYKYTQIKYNFQYRHECLCTYTLTTNTYVYTFSNTLFTYIKYALMNMCLCCAWILNFNFKINLKKISHR